MSTFKIGQKVVCKDASANINTPHPYHIEKGKTYIIENIFYCSCGEEVLCLKEIAGVGKTRCMCNTIIEGRRCYRSARFAPIQTQYNIISNKDLIKEIITKENDVPTKIKEIINN